MTGQKSIHAYLVTLIFTLSISLFLPIQSALFAETPMATKSNDYKKIETEVQELMKEGGIPGLTLVIIKKDQPDYVNGFGFADKRIKKKVTAETLFELGSCSKAFTGLATVQMAESGRISLDDTVSKYFSWFHVSYDDQPREITLRQLLHHTSGIPWNAIVKIPTGDHDDALLQTVKNISGMELDHEPGSKFNYSTVNYDILGAIIQQESKLTFENYMVENILKPLGMTDTIVGTNQSNPPKELARGYKIGFFKPRSYIAPTYRGNNPAGYIVTNGKDMTKWLKYHMNSAETTLIDQINQTHIPDLSVDPNTGTLTSYAMGWFVNQYGVGAIFHGGANPNFSSLIIFNKKTKTGVAVMTNSNSTFSSYIATVVYKRLHSSKIPKGNPPSNGLDKTCSVVTILLGLFLLTILGFFFLFFIDISKGRRSFEGLSFAKFRKFVGILILYIPFLLAIYLLPKAINDVSWEMALVWSPGSFKVVIVGILFAMAISYLALVLSSLFPQKNKYLKSIPSLLVLSLLTGGANAMIIFLVTGSIYIKNNVEYVIYYFVMALMMYIVGRKVLQTQLVKISMEIVYDMRMKLIGKIFYTSYQRFEHIDDGRILATLNNDTGQIGNLAALFVGLISSIVTTIGVFIYLSTIAFWATLVTISVIFIVAALYYVVGQEAQEYLQKARETQNIYMGLLNDMVSGFKELSMHIKKKIHYKSDLEVSCDQFRKANVTAMVKLINAFLVGESLLIVILGAVGFAVPRVFPEIKDAILMSFIIALLYLIGPINGILGSIPGLLQIKVAWDRVTGFSRDIPANMNEEDVKKPLLVDKMEVKQLDASGLYFKYKLEIEATEPSALKAAENKAAIAPNDTNKDNEDESANVIDNSFTIGPLNLEANKGELIFIVGGNGSGKTTLAKLLTGLYTSDGGFVKINGQDIPNFQLGEYFSVVFGDFHLFQKLYEIDMDKNIDTAKAYLEMLELDNKVEINGNEFSTIDLSAGQRKRLALMQCYLEDSPIYLFDEVAADQDPQFRKFFYRKLLPEMKENGKIVIAITHDDHYFDVADKVVKMDMGQIEFVNDGTAFKVTS
jgi:cyclic peptide transporter